MTRKVQSLFDAARLMIANPLADDERRLLAEAQRFIEPGRQLVTQLDGDDRVEKA